MRTTSTILAATLAVAPALVSAAGQLGFALGNTNADGSCKVQSDFDADFAAIKKSTKSGLVRTYSSSDQYGNNCNTPNQIMPAAKAAGFQVLLGVWPDGPAKVYNDQISQLQAANLQQYGDTLYGITIGSEGLYRGTYQVSDLLAWLADSKSKFGFTKIGTADSWNCWYNGSMDSIIKSPNLDLALANGFAYWQAQDIGNATKTYFEDMALALGHIQSVSGSMDKPHFMNGETGWPGDGGSDYGAAKAGTANEKTYWKSAVCGMLDWGVDLFWFEAFDEPKKEGAIGQNGQAASEKTWGAFNADRSAKFDMSC